MANTMYKAGRGPINPGRKRLRLLCAVVSVPLILLVVFVVACGRARVDSTSTSIGSSATTSAVPAKVEATELLAPSYPAVPANAPLQYKGSLLATHLSRPVPVKIPILEYHAVDLRPIPGAAGRQLTLSVTRFQQEMDYLAAHGYTTVTLDEIYAAMQALVKLPAKSVAITFDDGYLDNYTLAYPILRAHKFCATFFVITNAVGHAGFMTWDQLRQMHASGMSIESHTVHHWDLDRLSQDELVSELTQSRNAIAAEVGQVPAALSYPGGNYSLRVAIAAQAAGYILAVTNQPGLLMSSMSQFAWPRYGVGDKASLYILAEALDGRLGQKVHQAAPVSDRRRRNAFPTSHSVSGIGR